MDSSDTHRSSFSRRGLLGGFVGLTAGGTLSSAAVTDTAVELSVMTRNLYVGVDLFRLFEARSAAAVPRIAGQLLAELAGHPFPARVDAIAAEIEATRPDVVGLQEAASISTRVPGSPGDEFGSTAELVDLLDLLSSKLDDRGLAYDVAAETVTTEVVAPAVVDGRRVDLRVTDRTAILVRSDVETRASRAETFETRLPISVGGIDVSLQRGYCLVDVTIDGVDLAVATTHLESVDGDSRRDQARELVGLLPTDRPVVLAGDVNSGSGSETDAYELLVESFEDAHTSLRPGSDGFTCCHAPDLRNDEPRLSRRIDVVLYRDGLRPIAVDRVGAEIDDRLTADVDGETVRLWPSDHAGVVATFELPASAALATQTQRPSATEPPSATPSSPATEHPPLTETEQTSDRDWLPSVSLDGFGSAVALVALGIAALVRRRLGG